ncbi:hypothetical protein NW768_012094 [Fusarium equiseti]|uniref:Condensation domain-containing protein n=1 Tax=Fusarium equiseti TaxID=61235 RepID=A0ABQ8QVR1_FUSEQ|nr:hypothetical protein NW768_012094 [Fusarium equiseti]
MADMVQALDRDEDLLKEGAHDARTVDQKAYYLSTLQHLSQQAMPICADKVEQIYSCTGMQEMFLHGSEAWPGAHVTQWIFSLDETVDILAFGKAIDRWFIRYPTMRARIVRNKQTAQLVSGPTHLIWSLNHAAYDAWSLGMMLRSIGQSYVNLKDDPETPLPFSGLLRHIAKARNAGSESRSFWQTYLLNMGPQTLLFNYPSLKDPRQDCLAVYQVSFPKREGKTPTSLIAAAWILVLARLTHRIDITIAYLVTGRTLPVGGIDTCPGPLISKLPLRVRLPTETTGICDAADIVCTEMVRVMPHEHTGLDAIQSLTIQDAEATPPHAASLLGHLPFDLAIYPAGHTDFGAAKGIGMAHVGQRVVVPPPGTFSAECSIVSEKDNIEVNLAMIWHNRAIDKKEVDDIIGAWREIIADDTQKDLPKFRLKTGPVKPGLSRYSVDAKRVLSVVDDNGWEEDAHGTPLPDR